MSQINLNKNEREFIKKSVELSAYFGNNKKLAKRILRKINKETEIKKLND